MPSRDTSSLLTVHDLRTYFPTRRGLVRGVDGIDLEVRHGEVVGLVGESGCGKTVTAYSILGLVPKPGRIVSGEIQFLGENLRRKTPEEMRRLRGTQISMVFQEPLTALNPVFPVATQIGDVLRYHLDLPSQEVRRRVIELLDHVGIPLPEHVAGAYPFQLSGGMQQRVLIAMAIACRPELLIADEPTTALDTTIQAQIMDLFRRLIREDGLTVLLITHNLGIVSEMCQRVYMMYAGQIVEEASVHELFTEPKHPYTSGLLRCIPVFKRDDTPLETIKGTVPTVLDPPAGCRFADRCVYVRGRCREEGPALRAVKEAHHVACHFAESLSLARPDIGSPSWVPTGP